MLRYIGGKAKRIHPPPFTPKRYKKKKAKLPIKKEEAKLSVWKRMYIALFARAKQKTKGSKEES